eukprot:NODE_80_length_22759_cov_1.466858.p13 type:complete len:172 gc:universal NODE_80_length_22759_cov_1.466858:16355-15840(-)
MTSISIVQFSDVVKSIRDVRQTLHILANQMETLQKVTGNIHSNIPQILHLSLQHLADMMFKHIEFPLITNLEETAIEIGKERMANEQRIAALRKKLTPQSSAKKDAAELRYMIEELEKINLEIKFLEEENSKIPDQQCDLQQEAIKRCLEKLDQMYITWIDKLYNHIQNQK